MRVACDIAKECIEVLQPHQHPPEGIVDNLMHFLTQKCVVKCRTLSDEAEKKSGQLHAQLESLKDKLKAATRPPNSPKAKGKKAKAKAKVKKMFSGSRARVDTLNQKIKDVQTEIKELGTNLMNPHEVDLSELADASKVALVVEKYQAFLANIAVKGSGTPFDELLPPTARANLEYLLQQKWVQDALQCGEEVAANLDQNPAHQLHAGKFMPTILASISHMWFGNYIER
ncbi:unnamed protein product [Durusdinium trenchii]|uniref:Uncharacterized protein n=1 Tax=Durusdinium trenchii TaxID=1381693 RepID=A0ABP0MVT4_9DINO